MQSLSGSKRLAQQEAEAVKLEEIVGFLDAYLRVADWRDSSANGLQVEASDDVDLVAFAVDACMETFEKAKELGAQLLVVHHGIIWGGLRRITGIVRRRVEFLLKNGISLYAAHLPLDAHEEVGNNVQLLRILNAEPVEKFAEYEGAEIGYIGRFHRAIGLNELFEAVKGRISEGARLFDFGREKVVRIAVVSGRGGFAVEEAAMKADVFLTGEAEHAAFVAARDCGLNVIFAGHYATEVFGVRALMDVVASKLDIDVEFIRSGGL